MVDLHDPAVVARDYKFVVHLWHFVHGIFLWDYITTVKVEWEYLTGKRKFQWTLVLYSGIRNSALCSTICSLVFLNVTYRINCQQLVIWTLVFSYTAVACTSILIALRVNAIWNHNSIVMVFTFGMVLTNIAFLLRCIATFTSEWSIPTATCILQDTLRFRDTITISASCDITLLILMVVGLLRCHRTRDGIVRYLYVQGLIWLFFIPLAGVTHAIFINLNLSGPWNLMFQYFSLYIMAICTTRMYRALLGYNMDVHVYSEGPQPPSGVISAIQFATGSGRGVVTGTSTVPTNRPIDSTYIEEFALTVPGGDEEDQIRKIPSLASPLRECH